MTNRDEVRNESRSEPSNNTTKSKRHFTTFSATLTTACLGCKYVIRHCESKQMTQWMTNVRSDIAKEQSKFTYTLKQTCKVQRPLEKIIYLSEAVWSHSIRTRQGTTRHKHLNASRHDTTQTMQHAMERRNTNIVTRHGTTQYKH